MTTPAIMRAVSKFTIDNSPSLLTAVGVLGTVTTAVLTGKAAYSSAILIQAKESEERVVNDRKQRTKERVNLTWKLYIPASVSGILTVGAIVGANRIGTRRAAGLAAAYALSERAYSEYKDKIVETLGPAKEQKARDELAQEKVTKNLGSNEVVVVSGAILCHDSYTGRYFNSTMEHLKSVQNEINATVVNSGYATLSDFYDGIGIARTSSSDEVGWNPEKLLNLRFSTTISSDGRPCLVMDYNLNTSRNYWRQG